MKMDLRWNTKARWLYRILSAILGLLFLLLGVMSLTSAFSTPSFAFDSSFKFGVSATVFGLAFLVISIRGFLFKK